MLALAVFKKRYICFMQDLINEEEFLPKAAAYDPWRRFGVFYLIAFVSVIISYTARLYFDSGSGIRIFLGIYDISMPVLLALGMFLLKKQALELKVATIAATIFLLMVAFQAAILVMNIADPGDRIRNAQEFYEGLERTTVVYAGYFITCFVIVFALAKNREATIARNLRRHSKK
jgi:hypothetical protein